MPEVVPVLPEVEPEVVPMLPEVDPEVVPDVVPVLVPEPEVDPPEVAPVLEGEQAKNMEPIIKEEARIDNCVFFIAKYVLFYKLY